MTNNQQTKAKEDICPTCNGAGQIHVATNHITGSKKFNACSRCGGSGTVMIKP